MAFEHWHEVTPAQAQALGAAFAVVRHCILLFGRQSQYALTKAPTHGIKSPNLLYQHLSNPNRSFKSLMITLASNKSGRRLVGLPNLLGFIKESKQSI